MMREYTITRVQSQPDWSQIPSAPIDTQLWDTRTDIQAAAQVCYDDQALYVRLTAVEADIRAEETGDMASPCDDSCLEFFFSPMAGDLRYFNVEFNPLCTMYLGFAASRYSLIRLHPCEELDFGPQANRTENGWELTYKISFQFIRQFFPAFEAAPGKTMRGNFYKCGDMTPNPHYLSWQPVDSVTPDYHLPETFGSLVFG